MNNGVDTHFQSSDCGLVFTSPTLISSDELLEGYSSAHPEKATLRTSWHNLIDLCQTQNSMIYLRLVYPEVTFSGDSKVREQLRKFTTLYHHFNKFSGIEIDVTNGLLHSVCQSASTLQRQEEYINSIIQSIVETTTDVRISVRLSCLQHLHILTSKILYNKNVSFVHIVDVNSSLLRHSSMLTLFSYFNGSDPPLSTVSVHHDILLYRLSDFRPNIRNHNDLANGGLNGSVAARLIAPVLERTVTDPLPGMPNLRQRQSQFNRTGSPMRHRRKTGFQDEIEPFDREYIVSKPDDHSLSLRIAAWGWTILIFVWVTFILGVGSLFGLWDMVLFGTPQVKVTNYSAYEKETGYPIPYYYSNLILLGCVVAWVWCIVSWMGMKFFRHAKAGIDD